MRKRKFIAAVLATIMASTAFSGVGYAQDGTESAQMGNAELMNAWPGYVGIKFDKSTGTVTGVISYDSLQDELIIPSQIEGVKVTRIGSNAFKEAPYLSSIQIPESVEYIDDNAFEVVGEYLSEIYVEDANKCYSSQDGVLFDKSKTKLIAYPRAKEEKSYDIPAGVQVINNHAFAECYMTKIIMPDSVTYIGERAFYGNSELTDIELSSGLKEIGDSAFEDGRLESVTIPDGVTRIGDKAFYMNSLKSVNFSDGLTEIGDYAFAWCDLTEIIIPENLTQIGEAAFRGCTKVENVEVASSNDIYAAVDNALLSKDKRTLVFYADPSITDYTIPSTVTEIGDNAFNCINLESVEIHENISKIGDNAFLVDYSLAAINVSENNRYFISEDGVLFNKDKTDIIKYPPSKEETEYEIPYGVKNVKCGAFNNCSLSQIEIPDSVKVIEELAFCGISFDEVTIPDSVEYIGVEAFSFCSGFTNLIIPNSVKVIGDSAFMSCDAETLVIPEGVVSVGNGAFKYCDFVSVDIASEAIGESAFESCWNLSEVTLRGSVREIDNSAFKGCESLSEITMSDGLKKIGESAFEECLGIKSLTIPGSVTQIDPKAFYRCTGIKELILGNGIKEIGDSAFYWCCNIDSITIPGSVKTIGYGAFADCFHAGTIAIEKGTEIIKGGAFYGCGYLQNMTIPATVVSIGDSAFDYCDYIIIHGYGNSVAEKYALNNGIPFDKLLQLVEPTVTVTETDGVKIVEISLVADGVELPDNAIAVFVDADDIEGISTVTNTDGVYTAEVAGDANAVKLFFWDSFEDMHPIAEPVIAGI